MSFGLPKSSLCVHITVTTIDWISGPLSTLFRHLMLRRAKQCYVHVHVLRL